MQIRSDQSLSRVQLFATPWIAALEASLSITNSRSSLRLTSIESVMPSSYLILCRPLLLLPPIPPNIRVFSNESTLRMRWPKYWSFSFSIIPSKEIPGLISFRMEWTGWISLQSRGLSRVFSNTTVQKHQFFSAQPSSQSIHTRPHPYMTTGKTIALTRRTFVGKVMSLLLNMLSRLVITFLPRSKRLLISWLQSPSVVILEGLGAGGEGDDRGWDGWMASLTRWTWVWMNSGSWWWTGRPGVLWFMGSQRVGHDWVTDLIWSDNEKDICFGC